VQSLGKRHDVVAVAINYSSVIIVLLNLLCARFKGSVNGIRRYCFDKMQSRRFRHVSAIAAVRCRCRSIALSPESTHRRHAKVVATAVMTTERFASSCSSGGGTSSVCVLVGVWSGPGMLIHTGDSTLTGCLRPVQQSTGSSLVFRTNRMHATDIISLPNGVVLQPRNKVHH
jgi:hypothetical protein